MAFVALWGPFVAAVTTKALGLHQTAFAQTFIRPLFPWFFLVAGLFAVLAGVLPRVRRHGRATLDVVGDALRIRAGRSERTIAKADVASGIAAPTPTGADMDLRLRDGSVLRAVDVDRDAAERLLTALDVGPRGRRAVVTLGNAGRTMGAVVGATFAWLVGLALIGKDFGRSPAFSVAWVLFGVLSSWLAARVARPPEVTVGTDGVSVRGALGTRFVPFERIGDIEVGPSLVLCLTGGETVTCRGGTLAERRSLAERIRAAQASHAEPDASVDTRLARGDRSLPAWRASLGAAVRAGGSYRASALRPESLEAVLTDPASPVERRIGAALALAESGTPEARAKIRIAADGCAEANLRVAMIEAAADEPDDAVIEAALSKRAPEPLPE